MTKPNENESDGAGIKLLSFDAVVLTMAEIVLGRRALLVLLLSTEVEEGRRSTWLHVHFHWTNFASKDVENHDCHRPYAQCNDIC